MKAIKMGEKQLIYLLMLSLNKFVRMADTTKTKKSYKSSKLKIVQEKQEVMESHDHSRPEGARYIKVITSTVKLILSFHLALMT